MRMFIERQTSTTVDVTIVKHSSSAVLLLLGVMFNGVPISIGNTIDSDDVIHMISREKMLVVNVGETTHLDCEFTASFFNLFDNPVVWRKSQRDESIFINLMGNILEPFESAGRFKVTFITGSSRYRLGLSITDVALEDSGNYSCEVNGPFNSLLGVNTHYLFVRAPVRSVSFILSNTSSNTDISSPPQLGSSSERDIRWILPESQRQPWLRNLAFIENTPSTLHCLALGGYPPPEAVILVGLRDVTREFVVTYSARLTGVRGLRVMEYTTDVWSYSFKVGADDDGSLVKCIVTVTGLPATTETATVTTYHAPIIQCEPSWANHGDRNVFMRCQVRAKPEVTAVFWVIDTNGTTVSEGEVVKEHWTLVTDHGKGRLEIRLFIRQTKPESFQHYTLVAENSLSVKSQRVVLYEKASSSSALNLRLSSVRSLSLEDSKPIFASTVPRTIVHSHSADGSTREAEKTGRYMAPSGGYIASIGLLYYNGVSDELYLFKHSLTRFIPLSLIIIEIVTYNLIT